MAAANAMATDGMFSGIRRFTETLGDTIEGLRSSVSRRAIANPFGEFGTVAALASASIPVQPTLSEQILKAGRLTVAEARRRISSFVEGRFVPKDLREMTRYLAQRFLSIEARADQRGGIANYLVDTNNMGAVPAAQVDPRLAHRAMQRDHIRRQMRSYVAGSDPGQTFGHWGALSMTMSSDGSNLGYCVVGNQGWIGRKVGTASADPQANLRLMRAAQAKGVKLVLPEVAKGSARSGALIAGMDILMASRSVPAREIHSKLSHEHLSKAFGTTLRASLAAMTAQAENAMGMILAPGSRNVSDAQKAAARAAFVAKYAKRTEPEFDYSPAADTDFVFGGGTSDDKRDLAIVVHRDGALAVMDRDLGEIVPIAVPSLPSGEYDRIDPDGNVVGRTSVDGAARVRHVDFAPKPSVTFDKDDAGPGLPQHEEVEERGTERGPTSRFRQ